LFTSPFFRRLFLPYLLLICVATGVVGIVAASRLRTSYLDQTTQALRHQADLASRLIEPAVRSGNAPELTRQVRAVGAAAECRVTVVRADGTVVADNEADPGRLDNHRLRPEIVAAAANGEGVSVRDSDTLHEPMMYFARRVDPGRGDGPVVADPGFIRLAVHLRDLNRHLRTLYAALVIAGMLAAAAAGALCYHFARRSAAPVIELTHFAESLAAGELSRRVNRTGTGEIATLSTALNTMAESLGGLLRQTQKDKGELLAILSVMNEGVIAVDDQLKVLLVNEAAGDLLGFAAGPAHGRLLWEVVRNEPILRRVSDAIGKTYRDTFEVGPVSGRHLEVTICPFPAQEPQGLVLVAHDATESVRYQEFRKEFVANVSHELRTPLTAIKGFAETLRDGAMRDPVRGPQYLATIEKHADQLTNLIADLLDLSRLDGRPGLPGKMALGVGTFIRSAVDLLAPQAEKKSQTLSVDIPPRLPEIQGDPDYLERALANLLENAIKYTPNGGRVRVTASADERSVHIAVADNGIGIPADDLPRIFERFYRVDRSRSREMGGTGLGLSIVKHVAQAHGGSVEVDSTPRVGSTFTLTLPLPRS
jgi:two-component system phosphate regulon sensor histidine kinase PhoR